MERAQTPSSDFIIPRAKRVEPVGPDQALPPDERNPRLGLLVIVVIAALFYAGLAFLIHKYL